MTNFTRVNCLHVLQFYEELEALVDADDGSVFDRKTLDLMESSRQIVREMLSETEKR